MSCGRPIDWEANVCQYCGHDFRFQAHLAQPPKKNHTALVIVAVVVVVIVVIFVLPLLLYFMVLGFDGDNDGYGNTPGINVLRKSSIAGGFKIELTAPTAEVTWSDVTIQLSNVARTISWTNMTASDLTSAAPPEAWHYGSGRVLGDLVVFLNVTDLAANGRISNGDYIAFTVGSGAFASSATYTMTLLYEPTDGSMLSYDFTG